jgi:S1-C subfamily serine protease
MLDAQGRLIGINTMITGREVAMAVPVHVAKDFLVGALQLVQQRTAA